MNTYLPNADTTVPPWHALWLPLPLPTREDSRRARRKLPAPPNKVIYFEEHASPCAIRFQCSPVEVRPTTPPEA